MEQVDLTEMFANLPRNLSTLETVSVQEADALITDEEAKQLIVEEADLPAPAEEPAVEEAPAEEIAVAEVAAEQPAAEAAADEAPVEVAPAEATPVEALPPVQPPQKQRRRNKPVAPRRGIVNVDTLDQYFAANETVTLDAILEKRIPGIDPRMTEFKLLGRGRISKPLTVVADEFSLKAVKMLLLTGGKAIRKKVN